MTPTTATAPHPPYRAQVLVFWRQGRMEMRETPGAACGCGRADQHHGPPAIEAVLNNPPPQWNAPPGTVLWEVTAHADDADSALHTARQVAKALGFDMNPIVERAAVPAAAPDQENPR